MEMRHRDEQGLPVRAGPPTLLDSARENVRRPGCVQIDLEQAEQSKWRR